MICIGLLQIISRMMDQENESRQIAGYNNQIILFRLEIQGSTDGFFYFPDLLVFSTGIAGIRLIQKPAVEIGSLPLHMSTMQISNQMKTKMSWQTFSVAINQFGIWVCPVQPLQNMRSARDNHNSMHCRIVRRHCRMHMQRWLLGQRPEVSAVHCL